jgi:hypothetical protein
MTAERIYALLLRLYPRAFREEFGRDMLADFSVLHRANVHRPIAFWRLVLADVVRSAIQAHIDTLRAGHRSFLLRWSFVCATGIVVTGIVVTLFACGYRYFYHPFLEGMRPRDFSGGVGACVGIGLGITQSLMLRFKGRVALAWTAVSGLACAAGLFAIGTMDMRRQPLSPALAGLTLGVAVGVSQWVFLRLRTRHDGRWALATVAALAFSAVTFQAAIHSAFQGVNPLVIDPLTGPIDRYRALFEVVTGALGQMHTWIALVFAFVAMAVSSLIVGAFTAPISGRNHAH